MTNEEMRQNWAAGAIGWVQNEALFDRLYAPATAAVLAAAGLEPGLRMLDVGCGTGTLLAAGAEAGADVVGVDISPGMVDAARARVPSADVVVADAQEADLLVAAPGRPFDRVVSRFGVMFFADPWAAFTNLRRATAPGARLAFACWRGADENPVFSLGQTVLLEHLDPQPPIEPGAPGPTAFADPEQTRALLAAAGWASADAQALDFVCDYSDSGSDGVEERLTSILRTNTGRRAQQVLEPRLGADGWAELLDDVRAELRRHLTDGRLQLPAATWLVSAVNPGAVDSGALNSGGLGSRS